MGASTDNDSVTIPDDPTPRRMDDILSTLPPQFVVGPSGAFVLLPHRGAGSAVNGAATRLDLLVQATRSALCDHLSWIPFLDSLLVSVVDVRGPAPVTIVALDLLHDVLTEGPAVIDDHALASIRDAVRTERLDRWTVGSGAGAARIDLCDPAQPTTTR
jgi:hypothetical protein